MTPGCSSRAERTMTDTVLLVLLVAAGFIAGAAVGRWWLAGAIACVWLVLDVVVLIRGNTSSASEPSTELLVIIMAAVTAAAIVVALAGVAFGRALRRSSRQGS